MTLARLTTLIALATVLALGASTSPLASMRVTPGCNAHAIVALDVAAAAKTPSASGGTVGTAEATQLATSLESSGGNICTTSASAAIRAKVATIAALYRTNRTAAHQQLVALLAQIKSGAIHAPLRRLSSARRASTVCPDVQSTISVSDATKASGDLAAEAAAQQGGDTAGEAAAAAAATSNFEQWAADSGASSVGDWLAIARGAQALGDDSLATSALDSARSAADANVKKATPADPCKASPSELDCFIQANAVAQLVGATGTPDLANAIDCGENWSFTMVLSGQSESGTFGTFTWKEGRFIVNRTAGTITDANEKGPGWLGSAGGTYSCHGDGIPTESGTVTPFTFHYKLTGHVLGTKFIVSAPSADFNLTNPFHGHVCMGLATLGVQLINTIVKGGLPLEFEVAPGATKAEYHLSSGGSTFSATIQKLPS